MKTNKLSVHEGATYYYDQCRYQATYKGSLKTHKLTAPEGVKYDCDQCQYKNTHQDDLKLHKQAVYEGVVYSCSICDLSNFMTTKITKAYTDCSQRINKKITQELRVTTN